MIQLQHNIVNVLYVIKGLAESHLDQIEEGRLLTPEVRLKHAEAILKKTRTQSARALRITRELALALRPHKQLTIERPQNGRVSVRMAWRHALKALAAKYCLERFEMIERIPAGFPLIFCDRRQFQQILYDLLENSVQAMDKPGKLIFRVQVGFPDQGEPYAVINISDTGPGIPPEKLGNLFQPFFTTKPAGKGNGLGLYLVKELVERNGGWIAVSSFPHCGTTFTLKFPIDKNSLPR